VPEVDINAVFRLATEKFVSAANVPDPDLRKLVGHATLIDSLSLRFNISEQEQDDLLFEAEEHRPQDAECDESDEEDEESMGSDSDSSTSSESDDEDGKWRTEVDLVEIVELEGISPGGEAEATDLLLGDEDCSRIEAAYDEPGFPPLERIIPTLELQTAATGLAATPGAPAGPAPKSTVPRVQQPDIAIPARNPARFGVPVLMY